MKDSNSWNEDNGLRMNKKLLQNIDVVPLALLQISISDIKTEGSSMKSTIILGTLLQICQIALIKKQKGQTGGSNPRHKKTKKLSLLECIWSSV